MENIHRQVELICPTCGSKQFSRDLNDTSIPIVCAGCGRSFSKEELMELNQENISINRNEMLGEANQQIKAELQKKLKQVFGKNFKSS